MGYLGLYVGEYFGYYDGSVVPVPAPVVAGATPIAVTTELDHVAGALNRLCEQFKGASTGTNGIVIGGSAYGFAGGFAVPLGGPSAVTASTIITPGPVFVVSQTPSTIDHVTAAINRLCEQFKSAVPVALEEEIENVSASLGFDAAFDFAMG